MSAPQKRQGGLDDPPIPVRIKLAALWASAGLCYIYADYFELYVPGKLQSMLDGRIEPLGAVSQAVLLATAGLMAISSLMVVLSITLPPMLSRLANIVLGIVYSTMMLMIALSPSWVFYRFFGALEAGLTLMVVWYAWTWPRGKHQP